MPAFWDSMSPFYQRLPSVIPFAPDLTVDQVGMAAVAGVAGMTAAHGAASYARQRILGARERRAAHLPPALGPDQPVPPAYAGSGTPVPIEMPSPIDEQAGIRSAEAPTHAEAALDPVELAEPDPARLEAPDATDGDLAGVPPQAESDDDAAGPVAPRPPLGLDR
jgi:hypothetical protein